MNENKKFGDNYATRNPNFGKITALKNIELAQDPILWPFVKLEVYENGIQGSKATSRAIVPLFLFGREGNNDEMVDKHDIKLTLALNQVNLQKEDL